MDKPLQVNRAPVLTLWATVVAERLGYDHEESLTLGKAVAGLNAQSKGWRLGIYSNSKTAPPEKGAASKRHARRLASDTVDLLGRSVPVVEESGHMRALIKDRPIQPGQVERYLQSKFKEALPAVRGAMEALARSRDPADLEKEAFDLYERFRPEVRRGVRGWGQKGELNLRTIRVMVQRHGR